MTRVVRGQSDGASSGDERRCVDAGEPRPPVGAIILAGGASGRMGKDKSFLGVDGRPLIEHVYRQLQPHFSPILVSANDVKRYAFLNVRVVPDDVPGQGALMGIASALAVSPRDVNFVVACDIPYIHVPFVRRMLAETYASTCDGVVPRTADNKYEPLFAVYRRTMVEPMRQVLASGERRIRAVFGLCDVRHIALTDAAWLRNLNTHADYERFVSAGHPRSGSTRRVG